jgi:hypothetical protein
MTNQISHNATSTDRLANLTSILEANQTADNATPKIQKTPTRIRRLLARLLQPHVIIIVFLIFIIIFQHLADSCDEQETNEQIRFLHGEIRGLFAAIDQTEIRIQEAYELGQRVGKMICEQRGWKRI